MPLDEGFERLALSRSGASHKLVILLVGGVVGERVVVSSRAIQSHAWPPSGRFAVACPSDTRTIAEKWALTIFPLRDLPDQDRSAWTRPRSLSSLL
jgi:hypothetical protein